MDADGKAMIFGKTYSQKANMEKVMDHVHKLLQKHRLWNYIVLHADNTEAATWYADSMRSVTGLFGGLCEYFSGGWLQCRNRCRIRLH